MQHKRLLCALAGAVSLALALPAGAAPPERAVLLPGESLGGLRLGMTKADVVRAWGTRHGVCRGCPRTTWYFNYRPFDPRGAGVVFARGRVVHVFTLWRPDGWRTLDGLVLGAEASRIRATHPVVAERACAGYRALLSRTGRAQSVYYVFRGKLWGFGLTPQRANPCL